jgi:hypothetical protein
LYRYALPPQTFECIDECTGYFVGRVSVVPTHVDVCDDVISELQERGVDARILPNLWRLRDAVVASSLQFSIIRQVYLRKADAVQFWISCLDKWATRFSEVEEVDAPDGR